MWVKWFCLDPVHGHLSACFPPTLYLRRKRILRIYHCSCLKNGNTSGQWLKCLLIRHTVYLLLIGKKCWEKEYHVVDNKNWMIKKDNTPNDQAKKITSPWIMLLIQTGVRVLSKTLVECACLNTSSKSKTFIGKTGRNLKNVFIHCPPNDSLRRVTALEFYSTCFEKSITCIDNNHASGHQYILVFCSTTLNQ